MAADLGNADSPADRCGLCGDIVTNARARGDALGSYLVCASCAELWTTYLMHDPRALRTSSAEPPRPRTEFEPD